MPHQRLAKTPGLPTHQDGCRCRLCYAARRRAAQTLPIPNREPTHILDTTALTTVKEEDVLHADLVVTHKPKTSERVRIAQWLSMRAADPSLSTSDISKKLGLSPRTLSCYISRAVQEGWLRFDDPLSRLEFSIIPKTLDNLEHLLKDGDKQVTIEVAKGTIFKDYAAAKGISDAPTTVLALKIEHTSPEGEEVKVLTGHVVGTPRTFIDKE